MCNICLFPTIYTFLTTAPRTLPASQNIRYLHYYTHYRVPLWHTLQGASVMYRILGAFLQYTTKVTMQYSRQGTTHTHTHTIDLGEMKIVTDGHSALLALVVLHRQDNGHGFYIFNHKFVSTDLTQVNIRNIIMIQTHLTMGQLRQD